MTSLATALFVLRRAQARARKLAWLLLAGRALNASVPATTRQAGPLGGAGAALLMGALMLARARGARSHSRLDELHERLALLQAQVESRGQSRRDRVRDLVIVRRDHETLYRFRCNAFADAMAAAFLAETLASRHRR